MKPVFTRMPIFGKRVMWLAYKLAVKSTEQKEASETEQQQQQQ